ncbi:ChaN family lipoprotein [Rhabdochromatium marinum]|uniref:ChaN family lipoprotein n=1 Tax=Rhabdochromatium marinum TaxID=48729 RepID=UPI001F5B9241|nr:ChaN family lipoprotein [Rhabdochromatium marinum]
MLGAMLLCWSLPGLTADAEETALTLSAPAETQVLDVSRLVGLNDLVEHLSAQEVIFIGETHDNYADHLNQLAIIKRLHARGRPLLIGLECFQQPFQSVLDAYVAGTISEQEMLRQTEYFERWRFDYRLYRPILRFARAQGLPLIALNVPSELTRKVGDQGLAGLSAEERASLPATLDDADPDPAYRARIQAVFEQHPRGPNSDFEHFLAVQRVWDHGMAQRAVEALAAHPRSQLVVLAGNGHIEYGQGIPQPVEQRTKRQSVTILNGSSQAFAPDRADYLLFPPPTTLPPAGLLGVMLDTESDSEPKDPLSGVRIQDFATESGARDAGLKRDDRLVRIGQWPIADYTDVRIAMLDATPGERLPVQVLRPGLIGAPQRLNFEVELH